MSDLNAPWERKFIDFGKKFGDWIESRPIMGLLEGTGEPVDKRLADTFAQDFYGINPETGKVEDVPGLLGIVVNAAAAEAAGRGPKNLIDKIDEFYNGPDVRSLNGPQRARLAEQTVGGWIGPDGIHRVNFDTSHWKLNPRVLPKTGEMKKYDILELYPQAKELDAVIPGLLNADIFLENSRKLDSSGYYSSDTNHIFADASSRAERSASNSFDTILGHELQHLAQDRTGLTSGANLNYAIGPSQEELNRILAFQARPPHGQQRHDAYVDLLKQRLPINLHDTKMRLMPSHPDFPLYQTALQRGDYEGANQLLFRMHQDTGEHIYWHTIGEIEARAAERQHTGVFKGLITDDPGMDIPYYNQYDFYGNLAK